MAGKQGVLWDFLRDDKHYQLPPCARACISNAADAYPKSCEYCLEVCSRRNQHTLLVSNGSAATSTGHIQIHGDVYDDIQERIDFNDSVTCHSYGINKGCDLDCPVLWRGDCSEPEWIKSPSETLGSHIDYETLEELREIYGYDEE